MIILENHTSAKWIDNLLDCTIPDVKTLIWWYVDVIDQLLNFPRSWWIKREIPKKVAETVSSHCAKVAISSYILVSWSSSDIPNELIWDIILAWWTHDLCEWNCKDFTPHDIKNWVISQEQKHDLELESLRRFSREYKDNTPEKLFIELQTNPQFWIISELDKLDAWVMALNYEQFWFNVWEFFEYTKKKLHNRLLKEAFSWLLKREFKDVDFFYQYCVFLYFEWDLTKVREYIKIYG